jgi:hypothetical protein
LRYFSPSQGNLGKELMNSRIVGIILQQTLGNCAGCVQITSPHGRKRGV